MCRILLQFKIAHNSLRKSNITKQLRHRADNVHLSESDVKANNAESVLPNANLPRRTFVKWRQRTWMVYGLTQKRIKVFRVRVHY